MALRVALRGVLIALISRRQVDLPGYGHAVATRHAIKGWLRMIKEYITTREELIRYMRFSGTYTHMAPLCLRDGGISALKKTLVYDGLIAYAIRNFEAPPMA